MNRIDSEMSHYIHLSKYSRWLDKKGRRETWGETVCRYVKFWYKRGMIDLDEAFLIWRAIKRYNVMPSMRCLMTAGKALEIDNAAGYNCWGKSIDHPRAFDELFYLLMCGGGVGFSVERQHVNRLPEVPETFNEEETTILVRDSRIGWASSFKQLLSLLWSGIIPRWDLSRIRPAGARLVTFGGRASGPEPLDDLFRYTVHLFQRASGRKFNSLECHDLMCKVADTVVMGSVRRSACISVSNLTDDRMRRAKMGQWYDTDPHRALANNSVGYTEKPDMESFTKEFRSIYKSKAGERGIINKEALRDKALSCGRDVEGRHFILNPCGEAILDETGQACNLSEVIIRPDDTYEDIAEKVRIAALIGTLQSTLTDFRYLRKVWSDNIQEERLLGISMTGIMDHAVMSNSKLPQGTWFSKELSDKLVGGYSLPEILHKLKGVARETNVSWSNRLGIPASKQLTLVKPSGTVSQLCGTSSGIHPRYAKHYIRRVTQDPKDPLTDMLKDQKVPHVITTDGKILFEFPMKAPENAVLQSNMNAVEQLELWKIYREYWCDGNPSQTIYYTDDTFLDVQTWVWKHWGMIGGLSFFPVDDNVYKNAPYESISEERYEFLEATFPDIDWSKLSDYEHEDCTTSSQEFACSGGACEMG